MALSAKKEGVLACYVFRAMAAPRKNHQGRPSVTDSAAIERAAFVLFDERGFDETTMEDIAQAVGVGRRTLFRYFPSKNDIPWGDFDESLRHFRHQLAAQPDDLTIAEAVHRCIVTFNDFDDASTPQHRVRMRLILTTPALQAHSALRYEAWRRVIADFVAARLDLDPDDPLPRLVGHVGLAMALTSYEEWLANPSRRLTEIIEDTLPMLRSTFSD